MKKALSNSKIITLLLVAILMISAFAMSRFSLEQSTYAEQEKTIIASDDFSTNSIDSNVWNASASGVSVTGGALKIKDGAKIYTKKSVALDDSIITEMNVLTAKFDVKVNGGSALFLFGLDANGNINADSFGVEISATEATVLDYDASGNATIDNFFYLKKASSGSTIEIVVAKDKTLKVYENGQAAGNGAGSPLYTQSVATYAGPCGFVATSASTDVQIDNLTIESSVYNVPVSKSVSTSFADDYKGSPLSTDFKFKAQDASKFYVGAGALNYNGSSDKDYIGSSFEYDAFIVDYKITKINSNTGNDAWFGVDFGRASSTSAIGENCTLAFNLNGGNPFIANGEGLAVTSAKSIPASYFTALKASSVKASDVLNVRVIAKDSTIELLIKSAGEINFVSYGKVQNVDVSGYVALVSSNGVFMTLDDLAIINQSPIYNVPTNEAPEKVYDIIEAPHDYNKYRDNPEDLKNDLNYIGASSSSGESSGCGSSLVGSIVIPSAILMVLAAAVIIVRKAKEEK